MSEYFNSTSNNGNKPQNYAMSLGAVEPLFNYTPQELYGLQYVTYQFDPNSNVANEVNFAGSGKFIMGFQCSAAVNLPSTCTIKINFLNVNPPQIPIIIDTPNIPQNYFDNNNPASSMFFEAGLLNASMSAWEYNRVVVNNAAIDQLDGSAQLTIDITWVQAAAQGEWLYFTMMVI